MYHKRSCVEKVVLTKGRRSINKIITLLRISRNITGASRENW